MSECVNEDRQKKNDYYVKSIRKGDRLKRGKILVDGSFS